MKIITNTIPLLSPLTGVGSYIYNLLMQFRQLRPDYEYEYFYGYYSKEFRCYTEKKNRFYRIKTAVKKSSTDGLNLRSMKHFLARLNLKKYDLYFEPNFIPLDIRAKKIVTTVYDFSFHLHPEWHPKDRIQYFKDYFFDRVGRSDEIITISNYVEQEAREILKAADTRITAIPLGYDANVFNPGPPVAHAPGPGEKYLLFVGSIEPRKNLLSLLKAYSTLPEEVRKEYRLRLVGFKGWENRDVVEMIEKLKDNIDYLGYVPIESLADQYRNAYCFVYPSLYEGFGLPPLEAMACGCPVIVSDVTSLPEVCGDAALYVDPLDIDSIADGMLKMVSDEALREDFRKRGLQRATMFSWEACAREHLKIFERVMAS